MNLRSEITYDTEDQVNVDYYNEDGVIIVREIRLSSNTKHPGSHFVYAGITEFRKEHPEEQLWRYPDDFSYHAVTEEKIEIGDWIESEDGWVCQLLGTHQGKGKNGTVYFYRTAPKNIVVYKYKEREKLKHYKFFGMYFQNTNTLFNATSTAKDKSEINRWLALVPALGLQQAYTTVYGKVAKYDEKIIELLNTKYVQQHLKGQMETFRDKLSKVITEEDIVVEIQTLIEKSRKGSMAHRQNIEFTMQVLGLIPSPNEGKINKKQIEEADYTEVPPSLLKPNEEE